MKAIPNASNFTIPLKLENPNAIIVRPSAITGVRSKEGTMTFRVVLGGSRTAVAMLEAGNVAPVLEFCESKYEKPLAIAAIKLIGSDFAIVNLIAEVDDQRMQGKSKLKVLKRESLQCIGTTDVSPSTWNR